MIKEDPPNIHSIYIKSIPKSISKFLWNTYVTFNPSLPHKYFGFCKGKHDPKHQKSKHFDASSYQLNSFDDGYGSGSVLFRGCYQTMASEDAAGDTHLQTM